VRPGNSGDGIVPVGQEIFTKKNLKKNLREFFAAKVLNNFLIVAQDIENFTFKKIFVKNSQTSIEGFFFSSSFNISFFISIINFWQFFCSVENLQRIILDNDGATGARGLSTLAPWSIAVYGH
jgi:hypothetical protein